MKVELENSGEKRTVDVNDNGQIYVGKEYCGETLEIAFEVQE